MRYGDQLSAESGAAALITPMPLTIIRQDLTEIEADAIVNTANPNPCIGPGTDEAVYEAAGREELLAERKTIGVIPPGSAAVTKAYRLPAKIIIHAVGPVYIDGFHGEEALLKKSYRTSMELACRYECESIAFPLLGSGSNGFPKDIAFHIALDAIQTFLLEQELNVILAVYDRESFRISRKLFSDIRSYIEDHQIKERSERRGARISESIRNRWGRKEDAFHSCGAEQFLKPEPALMDDAIVLPKAEETFQKKLLSLIDSSGETDPAVYKRANIDRKLFAKIRKDENYRPSRKTAVALALALKLSLQQAEDLLSRAGYALSLSSTWDLIIRYCFEHHIFRILEVNQILLDFDQETL